MNTPMLLYGEPVQGGQVAPFGRSYMNVSLPFKRTIIYKTKAVATLYPARPIELQAATVLLSRDGTQVKKLLGGYLPPRSPNEGVPGKKP